MVIDGIKFYSDIDTTVAVIGGGISGIWTAYKLAKAGIPTIVVTYLDSDRGGLQGSSARSVGAINTSPLELPDFQSYLEELGRGVTHPDVSNALTTYLSQEIDELSSLFEVKNIKIGIALSSGSGRIFLKDMYKIFTSMGGQIINAWVTRLVVDEHGCRGLQYEKNGMIGKLRCRAIVLAAGGYANLYKNSLKTAAFGTMLGRWLECGGFATNLEFVFKHGYGNIDTEDITPTEQLAGAEVYSANGERVTWLEKLLFSGKATTTHLKAVKYWLQNADNTHFINLSYQLFYKSILAYNLACKNPKLSHKEEQFQSIISDLLSFSKYSNEKTKFIEEIVAFVKVGMTIDFDDFNQLKSYLVFEKQKTFKVKPISYFSMGGIAHKLFCTNVNNVYVTGENMHDFGSDRIGGLPWGLYLVSGRIICDCVVESLKSEQEEYQDFNLVCKRSHFDPVLLKEIQFCLTEYQEKGLNELHAQECIGRFRKKREELIQDDETLSDSIAWLIVAEGILTSSICRRESRGYFFHLDYPNEVEALNNFFSLTWYDKRSNSVISKLSTWSEINQICSQKVNSSELQK